MASQYSANHSISETMYQWADGSTSPHSACAQRFSPPTQIEKYPHDARSSVLALSEPPCGLTAKPIARANSAGSPGLHLPVANVHCSHLFLLHTSLGDKPAFKVAIQLG